MKVKHNGCPNNDWALLWTHHLLRSPALHSDSNPMVLKHLKIKSVNTHRGRWKTHGFVKVRCLFDLPSGKPGVTRGRIIFQIGVSITLAGEMPLKSLQIPMVFPWSFCGPHGFYVRSCQVTGISLGPYSSMRFLASSEVRPSRSPARGWKNGRLRHIETYWDILSLSYQTYHIGNPYVMCVQNIRFLNPHVQLSGTGPTAQHIASHFSQGIVLHKLSLSKADQLPPSLRLLHFGNDYKHWRPMFEKEQGSSWIMIIK